MANPGRVKDWILDGGGGTLSWWIPGKNAGWTSDQQCVLRRRRIVTTEKQGCGSAFISSGSGSSILGWIPIRIQGFNDQKMKKDYS
jgi:hypothetical protein